MGFKRIWNNVFAVHEIWLGFHPIIFSQLLTNTLQHCIVYLEIDQWENGAIADYRTELRYIIVCHSMVGRWEVTTMGEFFLFPL
jgi:hypothetical protein